MTDRAYLHRGSSTPLTGETIGECLDRIAAADPERDALVSVHQDRRLTYRQLVAATDQAARALLRLGVARGERVALWSPNHLEWVVIQLAAARIGAVLVNVNPSYRAHELAFVLARSRAKVLVLAEAFRSHDYLATLREVAPEVLAGGRAPKLPQLATVVVVGDSAPQGALTWPQFLALADGVDEQALRAAAEPLEPDDVVDIQFTSGTTGQPKGVLLTHHNILNNAYSVGEQLGLRRDDRVCCPVPFYHCFGMVITTLGTLSHGATLVIPSPAFEPGATLDAVQRERCTVLHGVPTMFVALLEVPDFARYDLASLRTGIMAGAPCPVELMRKVIARLHMADVVIAYGMTEASPATTMTQPSDSVDHRVTTVGRVMPHQELKVVDAKTGATVAIGEVGELCFRGYMVMAGYEGDEQATAAAIDAHGWLHSGDLGTLGGDGYVRITGRIKNMIIRGGENVYPREIEEFLMTLDPIADVQVVGVPDPKFGEEVLACVRLHASYAQQPPTPQELRHLCEGHIASHKIPRYWKVVDEYPLTVTGKVQKFKLREMARQQLEAGTLPDSRRPVERV